MRSRKKWLVSHLVLLMVFAATLPVDNTDAANAAVVANVGKYCDIKHPGSSVQIIVGPEPHPECCIVIGKNKEGQPTFECEEIDAFEACKMTIGNVENAIPGLNILCIKPEDPAAKCKQDRLRVEKVIGCTTLIEQAHKNGGKAEPWVFINRGAAYEQFGKTSEAIKDYSVAIELNTEDPVGYIERGNAYVKIGESDKGRKDLEKARSLNVDDALIVFNLGVLEDGIGNLEAAAKHYSEAIRLDPKFSNAYNNRANILCKLGQVENSVKDRIMVTTLGLISANAVQSFLSKHGYYKGENSGLIDSATSEAISAWTSDGCPGI